jgi:putative ABC transport system permease protein
MWMKKIKHKKTQMFLIGLVLYATTLLCTMCIAFTSELTSFTERGITKENCPDVYIFDYGTTQLKENINNETIKNNIKEVYSITGRTISVPVMFNGNDISLYFDAILNASMYKAFKYIEPDVENQELPQKGEVWISKTVSDPNNIHIGDTITLRYDEPVKLKVAGIYNTTALAKPMSMAPMLGNVGDINALVNAQPMALQAVNLNTYTEDTADQLVGEDPYMKMNLSRKDVRSCMTEVSGIMGKLGSAAGIIVFIVALVIIRFIIKTNLMKEYKAIGIYKSLGYTSNKIKMFYVKGYMFVGTVAIVAGAISSLGLVYPLGIICTKYVKGFSISNTSAMVCLIVILGLMALLYLNLLLSLKRVKKITPVKAMTVGMVSAEKKMKRSVIKSAKSPFAMAINDMFKHKKSTVMMMLVLTVSLYLSMLFVMGYSSSVNMSNKGNLWFAMPQKDAYISGNITEELKDYLKTDSYVKSSIYGECLYLCDKFCVNGKSSDEVNELSLLNFSVYDNMDSDITGVHMYQGEAPKYTGEVALGMNLMKVFNLKCGDYVKIMINDVEKEYLIKGCFQSMMNEGCGIMILDKDMSSCDSKYRPTRAYVRLESIDDFSKFKTEIEDKFPGVSVDDNWPTISNAVAAIEKMLVSIAYIFLCVFIIFAMLNTIIVITMDLNNSKRKYGIQKSLGFTTSYMIQQNLWKYSIITGISVIVATIVHKAISAKYMGMMVINAFVDNNLWLAIYIIGFVVVSIGVAWLLSLSIKKITPVDLMEE